MLPKLPVKAAAISLPLTPSRPAAKLSMGRSVPPFLTEEYNYSFSQFMGKLLDSRVLL
jgi:hypothetical protein